MAATTVTTRAVKGSALTHTEMDTNWNNLNNVGVGVGHITIWPMATAPDSTWLFCQGQSILVASYPDLFDVIGYTYGGSGANFFLPDYRGVLLRGVDGGAGRDPDRNTRTNRGDGVTGDNVGTRQGFAMQPITGSFFVPGGGSYSGAFSDGGSTGTGRDSASSGRTVNFNSAAVTITSSETRPINVNVNFLIKALL